MKSNHYWDLSLGLKVDCYTIDDPWFFNVCLPNSGFCLFRGEGGSVKNEIRRNNGNEVDRYWRRNEKDS